MKILISGGAGFIGGHTADKLLSYGYSVRILDNLSEPVHKNSIANYISPGAEFIYGDVRSKADWKNALEGIDVVFHFAAYQDYAENFSKFFDINSVGTALLYEVAVEQKIQLKKIIIASSQAVYGEGSYKDSTGKNYFPSIRSLKQLEAGIWDISIENIELKSSWTNEEVVNPQNQYGISKYTQELIALNLGKRYEIPTVCMRYSIVQGPRQSFYNAYSGACRIFSMNYFFNNQPIIYEDGKQLRDFINIEDVVDANILVMNDSRADYEAFSVGGGKAYTVLEFAEIAADVFGKPFNPIINGQFRFGDTRNIKSDITKLKSLGWNPKKSPHYSLECYKKWLSSQSVSLEIVNLAYKNLCTTNIVRKSSGDY